MQPVVYECVYEWTRKLLKFNNKFLHFRRQKFGVYVSLAPRAPDTNGKTVRQVYELHDRLTWDDIEPNANALARTARWTNEKHGNCGYVLRAARLIFMRWKADIAIVYDIISHMCAVSAAIFHFDAVNFRTRNGRRRREEGEREKSHAKRKWCARSRMWTWSMWM